MGSMDVHGCLPPLGRTRRSTIDKCALIYFRHYESSAFLNAWGRGERGSSVERRSRVSQHLGRGPPTKTSRTAEQQKRDRVRQATPWTTGLLVCARTSPTSSARQMTTRANVQHRLTTTAVGRSVLRGNVNNSDEVGGLARTRGVRSNLEISYFAYRHRRERSGPHGEVRQLVRATVGVDVVQVGPRDIHASQH